MPGLLSSIFDPAEGGTHAEQSQDSLAADAQQAATVEQHVGVDAGLTYHDADGASHEVALQNDVGVSLAAAAATHAVLTADEGSAG